MPSSQPLLLLCPGPSSIVAVTVSRYGLATGGVGSIPAIIVSRSVLFVVIFVFKDKVETVFFFVAHYVGGSGKFHELRQGVGDFGAL